MKPIPEFATLERISAVPDVIPTGLRESQVSKKKEKKSLIIKGRYKTAITKTKIIFTYF